MSIELKQAAQQAIDAFEAFGEADDFATLFTLTQKMNALRTAIQQAESGACKSFTELRERHREGVDAELAAMEVEREPVYQLCKVDSVSISTAWVDVQKQQYDDAALYPEYGRRVLYTHPAPGVPDDAIDSAIYSQCPDFDDWHEGPSIDDIRAIVRTATQAQKGQP